MSGLILGFHLAKERRRYKVMPCLLTGRKPRISPVYHIIPPHQVETGRWHTSSWAILSLAQGDAYNPALKEGQQLSCIKRGLTSQPGDWSNIAKCQLYSTFVSYHPKLCQKHSSNCRPQARPLTTRLELIGLISTPMCAKFTLRSGSGRYMFFVGLILMRWYRETHIITRKYKKSV